MYIWRQMSFPTCWGRMKAQQEVEEKWCARISCDIERVHTIGLCISRFLPEKTYSTWIGNVGINQNTLSNFPNAPGTKLKFKKERPSRGIIQKCALHERRLCAPKFEERPHDETLQQERSARKAAEYLANKFHKLKKSDKTTFFIFLVQPRSRSRFRSIDAHDEQKRMKLRRDGQSKKKYRNRTIMLTADGEVHTHEDRSLTWISS